MCIYIYIWPVRLGKGAGGTPTGMETQPTYFKMFHAVSQSAWHKHCWLNSPSKIRFWIWMSHECRISMNHPIPSPSVARAGLRQSAKALKQRWNDLADPLKAPQEVDRLLETLQEQFQQSVVHEYRMDPDGVRTEIYWIYFHYVILYVCICISNTHTHIYIYIHVIHACMQCNVMSCHVMSCNVM